MGTMGFMAASGGGGHPRAARLVSSSVLHKATRSTLDLLREADAVAVTHYNEVEGFLVSPSRYEELIASASRADEVGTAMPMLLAAAATGVAIPSETLDRLLPGHGSSDWRVVAEFAAQFPLTLTGGEDGEPIARARFRVTSANLDESGTDDELNLD